MFDSFYPVHVEQMPRQVDDPQAVSKTGQTFESDPRPHRTMTMFQNISSHILNFHVLAFNEAGSVISTVMKPARQWADSLLLVSPRHGICGASVRHRSPGECLRWINCRLEQRDTHPACGGNNAQFHVEQTLPAWQPILA